MAKRTPDVRTIKKGTTIHGGVAPKGSTKGGGPNGEQGLSNSSVQGTGILTNKQVKEKEGLIKDTLADPAAVFKRKRI